MILCYSLYGISEPHKIPSSIEDQKLMISNTYGGYIATDKADFLHWDFAENINDELPAQLNHFLQEYPIVIQAFIELPHVGTFLCKDDFRFIGEKLFVNQFKIDHVQYRNDEHTKALIILHVD